MAHIKTFSEFRDEIIEERKLNEGIIDAIKTKLRKVGEFLSGVGSKFLNALIRQSKKDLPKGVRIFPSKFDIEALESLGIKIQYPKNINEGINYYDESLNEATMDLNHPDKNVRNINTKEFRNEIDSLLRAALKGRKPRPVLMWGAPGIGKTAIIEAIAKMHGHELENNRLIVIDLQTMRPEDFFLPTVKGGSGKDYSRDSKAVRLPYEYLPLYDVREGKAGDDAANGPDGKGGIIFFDEIARCSPEVQDVCLKLCDDSRRIGNFALGSKWVIVCAANRESDETSDSTTYKFSSTLGNRFSQFNFVPKFSEWKEWAVNAKDEDNDPVVMHEILSFLTFFEDYWHYIDMDLAPGTGAQKVIHPTPRTWTNASIKAKDDREAAKERNEPYTVDDLKRSISAWIGDAVSGKFITFYKVSQEFGEEKLRNVYEKPKEGPDMKSLKGDMEKKFGTIAAVLYYKQKEKLGPRDKATQNFYKWLAYMDDEQMAVKAASLFTDLHKETFDKLSVADEDFFIEEIINPFLEAYPNLSSSEEALIQKLQDHDKIKVKATKAK